MICTNCVGMPIYCSFAPTEYANPKMRQPTVDTNGFAPPKNMAAMPMKPRPLIIPSTNIST